MKHLPALIVMLVATTIANAQTTAPATLPAKLPDVELSVHPAATPEPALTYELTPRFEEQTPGNAAPLYLMAFLQMHNEAADRKTLDDLLAAPDDRFSVADTTAILGRYRSALDEIELAARRDHCDWEIPIREQGVATVLPHLAYCRNVALLLSLRARVEISQGRFDDAVHTLATGFALVGHLQKGGLLIQGLVATAMSNILFDRVAQLQQAPGAPNLYWALSDLPTPLLDLRAMHQSEWLSILLHMPELQNRRVNQLSDQEIEAAVRKFQRITDMATGKEAHLGENLEVAAVVVRASGTARRWLLSHGYAEQKVKEMSPIRIVGIYFIESYFIAADNAYKWMSLPYWQQRKGLIEAEDTIRQSHAGGDLNPLMQLVPGISRVCFTVAKTERRLAMLRTVEALRAYAAGHDGKLPAALSDLTDMPAPADPVTGRSFDYEVRGATATLRSDGGKEHAEETQVHHIVMVEK